jgi:hypothetical protein
MWFTIRRTLGICCLIVLLYIWFIQFKNMDNVYKPIFLVILFVVVAAINDEAGDTGNPSIWNLDDKNLLNVIKPGENIACREMIRTTWRRAVILSFFILLIFNFINQNYAQNIGAFFIIWFLIYFSFNWEQIHRYKPLCQRDVDKN